MLVNSITGTERVLQMLSRVIHAPRQRNLGWGRVEAIAFRLAALAWIGLYCVGAGARTQNTVHDSASASATVEKVIIDTDIGIDIDDPFAIALALRSPELSIIGISTVSGDTLARAKILDRLLEESGHSDIPVAVGIRTQPTTPGLPEGLVGLQKRFGESRAYARTSHPAATEFILNEIRKFPGQITLVAIGPLTNVAALIERDSATSLKLKRVVMMGGSIGPIMDEEGKSHEAKPEYNIMVDIPAARAVFRSGIPIYVMPLNSTADLALDEVKRRSVFSQATPITDSLALLYLLWGNTTPVLYDAMAVAFAVDPSLCPVIPMRVDVNDQGSTEVKQGEPNVYVCLHSDPNSFFNYFMARVAVPEARNAKLAARE